MFKAVSDMCVCAPPFLLPTTFPLINVFGVLKEENTENRTFALFLKCELSKTRKQKALKEALEGRMVTGAWLTEKLLIFIESLLQKVSAVESESFSHSTGLGTSYCNVLPTTTCLFVKVELVILAGSSWNAK